MKTLRIHLTALLVGAFVWAAGCLPVSATDVWVDHWDSENVDVYVMDDTISYGTRGDRTVVQGLDEAGSGWSVAAGRRLGVQQVQIGYVAL